MNKKSVIGLACLTPLLNPLQQSQPSKRSRQPGRGRGGSPSPDRDALDRLIAAHAIAAECVLVTNNEADFNHYPGLNIENWVGN